MSTLADLPLTSEMSTPLHTSTLKLNPNEKQVTHASKLDSDKEATQQKEVTNNTKSSEANVESKFIAVKNSHNLKSINRKDHIEASKYKNGDGNVVHNIVNDLQSPSPTKIVNNVKETPVTNKQYQRKPIMGRSALLKKANIERDDSLIIYDLITEKYNGALIHYYDRAAQRRRLKIDSPDSNYSDTVFSSPPAYSPLSVSSIGTPSSIATPDERNKFCFPNLNELPESNEFRCVISTEKVSIVADEKHEDDVSDDSSSSKNDLRFIASTDNTNIETTSEDLGDSSTNSAWNSNEKLITSVSDYDPIKFLDNALGELTHLSMAYGLSNDVCDSTEKKQKEHDTSVGTSNLSLLLSKASDLCVSAKQRIKKRCSFASTAHLEDQGRDSGLPFSSDNILLNQLMRELSLQNEIMFQVSKALNYCIRTKKFESSVEFLEAEKILLVASCAKEALTKEIQNLEDEAYERKDNSKNCGELHLSNLTFPPKDHQKTDARRDFTEHFLVILTCGTTVLASDVVVADEKRVVNVKRSFNFIKLAADFEISVCIYAMRAGNKPHHNRESKTSCPSPKKILFQLKKGSKKYKVLSDVVYIKPSSFTLWGSCKIRSSDLSKVKQQSDSNVLTLKMHNTPLTSSLSGIFSASVNTAVKLTNRTNGFLTIGTDNEHGCTIWNRRWCVLEGYTLKYWNYPSEEVCSPLGSIDLSKCMEQRISFADRSMCARPRSLMLPVQSKQIIKKYLLSADSCSDTEMWEKEINSVICSLKVWNCTNF